MSNLYDLPEDILFTTEGGLRIITVNRSDDLNASTSEMLFAYPKLFRAVAEDPEARVAILTGAGLAFSVGGDMNRFVKTLDDNDFACSRARKCSPDHSQFYRFAHSELPPSMARQSAGEQHWQRYVTSS